MGLIDRLLDFIYDLVALALAILPDSPFQEITFDNYHPIFTDVMAWINYFVPIGAMLGVTTAYTAAVLIWYGARWVLRLGRYIQ